MAESPNPILKVDLGANGGALAFNNLEEIRGWLNVEKQTWAWLINESANDGNLNPVRNRFQSSWNSIEQQLNTAMQPSNRENVTAHISQIGSTITGAYGRNGILHSANVDAKFLETIQSKNVKAAAYAAAELLGLVVSPPLNNLFAPAQAVVKLDSYRRGIGNNAEAERLALETLRATWTKEFDEHRSRQEALSQEFQTTSTKIASLLAEKEREFTDLRMKNEAQFVDLHKEWQSRFKGTDDAYAAHMVLQGPVTYWEGRRNKQYWFSGASLALALIGGGAGICYLNSRFEKLLESHEKVPPIPEIAYSVILVSLFIWGLRILVRLLLANIHHALDAEERMVMAKTFLALVKDQSASRTEDRTHILQALFRSASTGLVTDDGSPPYPQDILIKMAESRRG